MTDGLGLVRCVNLDWLECYCLEDYIGYPHNAEYFREQGFRVIEREYGTPVYHEMFTLCSIEDDQPFIEVRRNPKSAQGRQVNGVLDPMACHVRLTNRTCYFSNAADIMQEFLERYGLHFQRISRVDVCLDFVRFDYGDDPATFMARFFRGRYSKINQARIRANGQDLWDGRIWNSVSWANPKSMVGTKFYNKTMELRERADKPYIRQQWRECGFVDDDLNLTKHQPDGTDQPVDVWRVEFSIKSGTRKWFVVEDNSGKRMKRISMKNTLAMYRTKPQLLDVFLSLAEHYFHFKRVEWITSPRSMAGASLSAVNIDYDHPLATTLQQDRRRQRKDRCSDKLLFNVKARAQFIKLENVATATTAEKRLSHLEAMILSYRDTHTMPTIFNACNILLEELEKERRTASMLAPWPLDELTIIRLLIARRIHGSGNSLDADKQTIEALLDFDNGLFGETSQ